MEEVEVAAATLGTVRTGAAPEDAGTLQIGAAPEEARAVAATVGTLQKSPVKAKADLVPVSELP